MKKTLLLFVAIVWVAAGFAQSLQLSIPGGRVLQNGEIYYYGGSPDEYMAAHVTVTNISDASKDVLVRKYEVFATLDSNATFCWGLCFPWFVNVSPDALTLEPGVPSHEFTADYMPNGIVGHTRVLYTFFDERNPVDSVSVFVEFSPTRLGLSDLNGEIFTDSRIKVEGAHTTAMLHEFTVTNHSLNAMDVQVRRIDLYLVPGSESFFCWGACYPPEITQMPEPVSFAPGQASEGFSADYDPKSHSGTSTVTYVFYDVNNPADSVWVNFAFDGQAAGTNNPDASPVFAVYPNPAVRFVEVNYQILSNFRQVSIHLSDLTGRTVRQQAIQSRYGQTRLDVSDVPGGLYLVSLYADNQLIQTRKLVINR